MERGFKLVRPLAGGLDAWVAAGFPVEDFGAEQRDRPATS
jgi:3-mercaptopyruvate sulfurtransferase SseA